MDENEQNMNIVNRSLLSSLINTSSPTRSFLTVRPIVTWNIIITKTFSNLKLKVTNSRDVRNTTSKAKENRTDIYDSRILSYA